jgi:hypothetical protein
MMVMDASGSSGHHSAAAPTALHNSIAQIAVE